MRDSAPYRDGPCPFTGLDGRLGRCVFSFVASRMDDERIRRADRNPDHRQGLGAKAVLETLAQLPTEQGNRSTIPAVVIWGMSITEAEALRFLQAGAKGILRKSADTATVLSCLRAVAQGRSWMQDSVFRESMTVEAQLRSELTPREHQVMELVEQGFKNREIAQELGIRPGTVKIHLKHIFEKTGVRGRHGLALNGLRQKGVISLLAS